MINLLKNKYFLLLIIALIGFISVYFYGDDNPIEEVSEYVIKEETGMDIDLTPKSLEHDADKQ